MRWCYALYNNMNKYLMIRAILGIVGIMCIGYNSLTNLVIVEKEPKCLDNDFLISITEVIHKFFFENTGIKYFFTIITSGILDISLIYLSYLWIFKLKNWRVIFTFVLFFIFKMICSWIFIMKTSEDIILEYPGFPSLTVSYLYSRNSFFSGIIGIYTICVLEFLKTDNKIMGLVSLIGMIMYFFQSISFHSEYYVSLFCGFISAHYFFIVTDVMIDNKHILFNNHSIFKIFLKSERSIEISTDKHYEIVK